MSDRFKNSKSRQYVAELLRDRERAMKQRIQRGRARVNEEVDKITRTVKENVDRGVSKVKEANDRHVKPLVRKMITGDKDKKVRVYFKQPSVIRYTDRMCFCVSILCMMTTHALLLTRPHLMVPWYLLWVGLLMSYRAADYYASKYHLFLLDFCYFVQFMAIANVTIFNKSTLLSNTVFAFANGPLAWAIMTWRNSLVFHDVDKITSTFIHLFPPLLTFAMRWHPLCWQRDWFPNECHEGEYAAHAIHGEFTFLRDGVLYPALFYLMWQLGYLVITEVTMKSYIYDDPDMQTSLRWLTTDTRGGMYKLVTGCCVRIRVLQQGELLDATTMKTKLIFVVAQFLYTLIVLLPVVLLHRHYILHCIWLCYLFGVCVWNGGSYYIEVFSRRYQKVAFADKDTSREDFAKETPASMKSRAQLEQTESKKGA